MAKAHSARAHARLSPSGAYRWFACPGSVSAEAPYPETSSVFADEGTAAHTLAEKCLVNGTDAADFLGGHVNIKTGTVDRRECPEHSACFDITDEMVDAVQTYLDTVRSLIEPGDEYEFEAKLDLRHIPGMEFGTGDFIRYRPSTKALAIADLKYGKGVYVSPKRNKQGLTYAEGTAKRFHNMGLDQVDIVIVQPRCPPRQEQDVVWLNESGTARMWSVDVLDLVEFRNDLIAAAEETAKPDAELVAGDHCGFCKHAANCRTLQAYATAEAEDEFGDTTVVDDLEPEVLTKILAKADTIKAWIKRVEARAHDMALQGNPPPGTKLVHSTSHRKFRDEVTAEYVSDITGLDVADLETDPKLRSPAQIEKMLGKKRHGEIADLWFKPKGKVILVPVDDPREAVKPDAEEEFA